MQIITEWQEILSQMLMPLHEVIKNHGLVEEQIITMILTETGWQTQKNLKRELDYIKNGCHTFIDYHEQHYNEPYYFAPAVEPYHELITDWQENFNKL